MTTIPTPDGRTLELSTAGPEGAPLVLVQHGTPGAHDLPSSYVRAADELGLRLAAWARPGYAGSTRLPGRTVADVVPDALAVADWMGATRFATTGGSGGGPHALAVGALAPGRCVAVATVAGVGPYGDATLDFLAGMGQGNIEEFGAALSGEDVLRPLLDRERAAMTASGPAELVAAMRSVLSPPDVAVLTGQVGQEMHASMSLALSAGVDGWLDDDLAFCSGWGFTPADVRVPVQLWQGGQDLMVPPAHGAWLAERLPSVVPHLLPDEGHLTLHVTRIRDVLAPLRDAVLA